MKHIVNDIGRFALSVREIAALFGCSISQVRKMKQQGLITPIPALGKRNEKFAYADLVELANPRNKK